MKKLFTSTVCMFLLAIGVFSQVQETMSYQAIIRDASDSLIVSSDIGLQISILQGDESGAAIYVEKQNVSTNASGVLSFKIGEGTLVSGNFLTIDWSDGPYFVKTEADPTGGDVYTITGTSQLLNVPYALHAKTAGSLSGAPRYVGEFYGGGIVFWVDQTGRHGLVMSLENVGSNQVWSNVEMNGETNSWDGSANSDHMVSQDGHTSSAAKLCLDYTNADYGTGVYSDWYLPSVAEFNLMWKNFYLIQKAIDVLDDASIPLITRASYWTSTEHTILEDQAFDYSLSHGKANPRAKSSGLLVRAVRSF